ncbi:MAG TPA: DNA polymerase/3'-5' exonuclease PolX [Vicinamibacterales bacterium]|nr:DNA polymerase/3'-5' exonuclease PolX [Vicinamibacterales bacterium]
MDNHPIAQVFAEIADLLEIKGENVFKIRAYRSAADTINAWADPVARMDEKQLLDLPGIGKDLAKKIRELAETGTCRFHQDLLLEFPPTILDLLRLQGVGPKTVALLYSSLNIRSVEELVEAAKAGRLRALKGMGAKKEALILKAVEEREKDRGRHLLSDTTSIAAELVAYLREHAPAAEFTPVGSLRRGCETCGDIDILATGAEPSLMEQFVAFPRVERILGQGDTKSSIRILGGYQADLRLVPPESRGAAMQYFTGSKAHNVSLRDRAIQHGFKLNEYGLFRVDDDSRVAGDTEEGIYEALGMAWVPPELRENRGEIDASIARQLPRLVSASDLRGDLHMHTTVTDGRDDLDTMAAAAQRLGYSYIAITDHSKALAMSNGLDENGALAHAARIRALNGRFGELTLLAGIECDILADGTLDLAGDCLAQLDIVIASVHSHYGQDETQTTDRILRAIECPWVDVLGHPMSRRLLQREPLKVNFEQTVSAAVARGVAFEINSQPDRLDLSDALARVAHERGATIVISTDAHSTLALGNVRWGVQVARRAWLTPEAVLNTRPLEEMRAMLRRNRRVEADGR